MRQISVRITEENHRKIGEISKKTGIEYAQVLRNLLEAGIRQAEEEKQQERSKEILERILRSALFSEQTIMRMFDVKTAAPFDEKKKTAMNEIFQIVEEMVIELNEKFD